MLLDGQQKNAHLPAYKKWLQGHIFVDEHWNFPFLLIIIWAESLNSSQTKPSISICFMLSWPLCHAAIWPPKKWPPPPYKKWPQWHIYIDEHWNFPFLLIIIWAESLNSNQTKPSISTWFMLTWPLWHAVRRPPKNAHLPLIKMTPMTLLCRWALEFSFLVDIHTGGKSK